jgi:hypothetical protein
MASPWRNVGQWLAEKINCPECMRKGRVNDYAIPEDKNKVSQILSGSPAPAVASGVPGGMPWGGISEVGNFFGKENGGYKTGEPSGPQILPAEVAAYSGERQWSTAGFTVNAGGFNHVAGGSYSQGSENRGILRGFLGRIA